LSQRDKRGGKAVKAMKVILSSTGAITIILVVFVLAYAYFGKGGHDLCELGTNYLTAKFDCIDKNRLQELENRCDIDPSTRYCVKCERPVLITGLTENKNSPVFSCSNFPPNKDVNISLHGQAIMHVAKDFPNVDINKHKIWMDIMIEANGAKTSPASGFQGTTISDNWFPVSVSPLSAKADATGTIVGSIDIGHCQWEGSTSQSCSMSSESKVTMEAVGR
jgi:hypothetical protein